MLLPIAHTAGGAPWTPASLSAPALQPARLHEKFKLGTRDLGTSDFGRGRDVGCRTLHEVRATASAFQTGLSPAAGPAGAGGRVKGEATPFSPRPPQWGRVRAAGRSADACAGSRPRPAPPGLPVPGLQQHLPFARRQGSHPIPRGRLMSIVSGGRTTKALFQGI